MKRKPKHLKKSNTLEKKILITLVIIALFGTIYILIYLYNNYQTKKNYLNLLKNIEINKQEITEKKSKRILQLEELAKINNEIVGWLEIEGTNINFPVLQGKDNDYYLNNNYKKEKAKTGSIFLDKEVDLKNGCYNYLIYGHRDTGGLMFEDLMKYKKEDFYKNHKKIRFTTLMQDSDYEIVSVFNSQVYYKDEREAFKYYQFVNASDEKKYNKFVNSAKKISIYDTGVNAKYGDQLLTLSTCEYSKKHGRFVILCKRMEK